MIVLDEQISKNECIRTAIGRWYHGPVVSLDELRPRGEVIKDDLIPDILREHKGSIFVTINSAHFWRVANAHTAFCIVCLTLKIEECDQIPDVLRRVLASPALRSKRDRCGKVVRAFNWRSGVRDIEWYERLSGPIFRVV